MNKFALGIMYFLTWFNLVLLFFIIHETGHYIVLKNYENKTISEICFLGIDIENNGGGGWVQYYGNSTTKKFHYYWDLRPIENIFYK